ncbi:MAG: electron transfer flavoprotein subunit beta [Bryobacteraceae bacterium]
MIALCAGPERVTQTVREALAKAQIVRSIADDLVNKDTLTVARLLADAVQGESPDLLLTGLQSDDLGYGQTGVVIAELLGWPHGTIVMQVEKSGDGIRIKRELENGYFQHVSLPLPAVVTIQSGINKLRYATLMGIKKAKAKEIKVIDSSTVTEGTATLARVYAPEKSKQTQLLQGNAHEAAAALVEKLRLKFAFYECSGNP